MFPMIQLYNMLNWPESVSFLMSRSIASMNYSRRSRKNTRARKKNMLRVSKAAKRRNKK